MPKALVIANTTLSIAVTACKACPSEYSLVENIRKCTEEADSATNQQCPRPIPNSRTIIDSFAIRKCCLCKTAFAKDSGFGGVASDLYKLSCDHISLLNSIVGSRDCLKQKLSEVAYGRFRSTPNLHILFLNRRLVLRGG